MSTTNSAINLKGSSAGGVAIRLKIDDTVFTFVDTHLAAYDDMVERRNADFHELRRGLNFPSPAIEPRGNDDGVSSRLPRSDMLDSDYIFWLVSRLLLSVYPLCN